MARRFALTSPVVREHPLQRQIAALLTVEIAPPGTASPFDVVWWAVDHAHYGGRVPGARMGRGITAGQPDLNLLFDGRGFYIELKTVDGRLRETQRSFGDAIQKCRGRYAIARNADEVLACLDRWQIPRNRRIIMEGASHATSRQSQRANASGNGARLCSP